MQDTPHKRRVIDTDTESEVDKLSREEALALLKDLYAENEELGERSEDLANKLQEIASKVKLSEAENIRLINQNQEVVDLYNYLATNFNEMQAEYERIIQENSTITIKYPEKNQSLRDNKFNNSTLTPRN